MIHGHFTILHSLFMGFMSEQDLLYGDLDDSLQSCLSLSGLVTSKAEQDLSERDAIIQDLQIEIGNLKTALANAKAHFQVLFNTASAEIARKDCIIEDLQQQLDSTAVHFGKKITKDKSTNSPKSPSN